MVQHHFLTTLSLVSRQDYPPKELLPKHTVTSLARGGRERGKEAPCPLFWLHAFDKLSEPQQLSWQEEQSANPSSHWAWVMPPGKDLKHIHLSPGPPRAAVH